MSTLKISIPIPALIPMADMATKAIKDSDGNIIKDTYVKKMLLMIL